MTFLRSRATRTSTRGRGDRRGRGARAAAVWGGWRSSGGGGGGRRRGGGEAGGAGGRGGRRCGRGRGRCGHGRAGRADAHVCPSGLRDRGELLVKRVLAGQTVQALLVLRNADL